MKFPEENHLLDPTVPEHRDFLAGIQGNILKGHGRKFGKILVWRLPPGAHRPGADFWSGVQARVTSAWEQYCQARKKQKDGDTIFRTLALTAQGMLTLGRGDRKDVAMDNTPGTFGGFNVGMRNDPWCQDELTQTAWDPKTFGRAGWEIHGVWLLACNHKRKLETESGRLKKFCQLHKLEVMWAEPLTTWKRKGRNREAFGFADGISVPAFFVQDKIEHKMGGRWMTMPISQVLIPPETSARHAGGSFLVLRKLEQKVKTFRAFEASLRRELANKKLRTKQAAALLIGRYRDGEPLVGLGRNTPRGENPSNHFDHIGDRWGKKCPFHAHIRKMNPRSDLAATAGGLSEAAVRETQLVRRGMVYDPAGRLRRRKWTDTGVGLMFLAYTSNIRGTFSVLQGNWVDEERFPCFAGGSGQDPLLSETGGPWRWGRASLPAVPRLIQPMGGEYFYVPSLPWLHGLRDTNGPDVSSK